jgi:hypothetical protein
MAVPPTQDYLGLWVNSFSVQKRVEPTTGLEPVNLFLTKEVLYQLSYVGSSRGIMEIEPGTHYTGPQNHRRE